jgi:hypothetical protein
MRALRFIWQQKHAWMQFPGHASILSDLNQQFIFLLGKGGCGYYMIGRN